MADVLVTDRALPVQPTGTRASGWYGLIFVIGTEAALFAYLLFSYFFLASQTPGLWPPHGVPSLRIAGPNTVVLLASSVTAWWGESGIERGDRKRLIAGLIMTLVLGTIFTALQIVEWRHQAFAPSTDAYGSLYFTITGVHVTHVAVGLIVLLCLIVWAIQGRFSERRHLHVAIGVYYWHFIDVVWIAVFTTFYLSPYLRGPG